MNTCSANSLTNANLVAALIPFISNEVKRAEGMNTVGASKLKAVMENICALHSKTSSTVLFDSFSTQIEETIEALVTYFHKVGSFVHNPQKLAA